MAYNTRFKMNQMIQEPKEPVPEAPKSSGKKETKKKVQEAKEPVPSEPVVPVADPREQLLNTNLKDLTPDEKKARKAYKQKLLRLKKKETDENYNQAEKERMRKKRKENKKEREQTLKDKNKLKKENKQVQILTENYEKQLKELRKQKETVEKEINEPVIVYVEEKKSKKKPDEEKVKNAEQRKKILTQMDGILKKLPHPNDSGIGYDALLPNLREKIMKLFNEPNSRISDRDLNFVVKRVWFVNNLNIEDFMERVMKLPTQTGDDYLGRSSINTYLSQGWQHVLRELALLRPKQFEKAYHIMREVTTSATVKNTEVRSKNELLVVSHLLLVFF